MTKSVLSRFKISLVANSLRSLIAFGTGLLIARSLGPSGYGDLMFLLGSFVAIRTATDMGSSNAYFTFLSQRTRPLMFNLAYFAWQVTQFFGVGAIIWFILPESIFEKIWLSHSRDTVMLAFFASFMQQQLWHTVTSIAEAARNTITIQLLNVVIAVVYLVSIMVLLEYEMLTIDNIFILLVLQYLGASILSYWLLKDNSERSVDQNFSYCGMVKEYWRYCRPLILVMLMSFVYEFFNNWLLQEFGGSSQQGYFQAVSQIASLSILVTTAILRVFWKEIAAAWVQADLKRVEALYFKVSRSLVMFSAIITGALFPWSKEIVINFLGPIYADSWAVLAIMLLYPIYQSLGQVGGTMLLASGFTNKNLAVSTFFLVIGLPVSYITLAPHAGVLIPGLELGAIGMASKTVLLAMVSTNFQVWLISRYCGWVFDWQYQFVGIPIMLALGYLTSFFVRMVWQTDKLGISELIIPIGFSTIVYMSLVLLTLWVFPWLIGTTQSNLKRLCAIRI